MNGIEILNVKKRESERVNETERMGETETEREN